MKILIVLLFVSFNSYSLFAKKQLLIYHAEKEISLMCDYTIIDDTILVLSGFKSIKNEILEEEISFLKDVNESTIYSLNISGLKISKNEFTSEANSSILKIPDSILVKKIDASNLKLKQIVSINIGERDLVCGNVHKSVKKIMSQFKDVTVVKINSWSTYTLD